MAGITPATISVEEVSSGSPVDTKRLKTFIQRHLFPRVPLVLPPETPRARRHAIPSGPWPWVDFSEVQHEKGPVSRQNSPTTDPRKDWKGYPQSLFPNWQPSHIRRSRIEEAVRYLPKQCTVRFVDILANPPFTPREIVIKNGKEATLWEEMHKSRPKESRLRAVFLDRPSGPVLQMIGTKYNIEPFFWSSSLNRLPSRYQEEHRQDVGDHITVTLLFMSIVDGRNTDIYKGSILPVNEDGSRGLLQELLAVHLIRNTQGNTIITFHPNNSRATSARHLQSRIVDAGRSVYWTDILENTNDPTFILLIFMWYAIYAWDQALEELYDYISRLEERVTERFDTKPTKILHNIHAHLLSYQSLLRDFTESIHFILDNRNPSQDFGEHEVKRLQKECRHLLSEVERLEMGRQNYQERLKNAMNMLFSTVNINDSNQMRKLTQVAVRDSRAMKQVSILTMIFLPASFAASAFGMNITLLTDGARGTLAHYVETAIPLTILTIWFIVASQTDAPGSGIHSRGWHRLAWPYRFARRILLGKSVSQPTVTPNNSIVDLEAQVVDDEEGDQKGRGI